MAICAKRNSFISTGVVGITLPRKSVRLRKGRVFVGANSAPVVPTVSKVGRDRGMCADAALLSLGILPRRLVVINKKCVKLRFTSVCTRFKDGIALLRKNGQFVPHGSRSVTGDIGRILRGGKVRVRLGTHTRSVRSAGSNIALACSSMSSNAPCFMSNSTVLVTAKQGPVVRKLGLRTTNVKISTRKTVIIGSRLHAAIPRI